MADLWKQQREFWPNSLSAHNLIVLLHIWIKPYFHMTIIVCQPWNVLKPVEKSQLGIVSRERFFDISNNSCYIRFYGRDSGVYKFQIHAGILSRGSTPSGRRLVAFTFHPSAPFAISVQRANAEYLVHFHLRLDPHSVLPLH
jgi:hypothetical protein